MDEKALLLALSTKIFNKTETELLSMLYDIDEKGEVKGLKADADQQLYNLDAQRVKGWKDRSTESMTKLAAEKTAAINSFHESKIKELFGITEPLQADDLYAKVAEIYKSGSGDGKGKTTKEYLELEGKFKTTEQKLKEWEQKVAAEYVPKTEVERMGRLSTAESYANRVLSSLKLIKDENAAIQQNKVKYFNAELKQRFDDIQMTEDGKVYPLLKGNRIENMHNQAVELGEIVKEVALGFWMEEKQPPTGNGGGKNDGGGGGHDRAAEIDRLLTSGTLSYEQEMALRKEKFTLELKK
jgi:hypothetical protein